MFSEREGLGYSPSKEELQFVEARCIAPLAKGPAWCGVLISAVVEAQQ